MMSQAESIDGANVLQFPDVSGGLPAPKERLAEVVVITRLGGAAANEVIPVQSRSEEIIAAYKALKEQSLLAETSHDQSGLVGAHNDFDGRQEQIAHYNAYIAQLGQKSDIAALL